MRNNEERITNNKRKGLRAVRLLFIICSLLFLAAREAAADIVVFKNGRTMSVKSLRIDADTATMQLRDGGEATFPASVVARVDPDEVLAARPFADLISSVAATHHLDARLVHAVIEQESNYQARARSKKGAKGLMQLMPGTAKQYGVSNSYDPKSNLEAGVRHLKDLLSRLDLPMALAAYNAGEATIQRYGGLPPFPETQSYVRDILRRVGSQ